MKRLARYIAYLLLAVSASAELQRDPHTDKPVLDDDGKFTFVIMGDRTGGHRSGVFAHAVESVNLLQPDFVVSIGDCIEGYTSDEQEWMRQWDAFDDIIAPLDMRFYYLVGNHDIHQSVPESVKLWKERHGRLYYHRVYKEVLLLFLNTEDIGAGREGRLSHDQVAYFQAVLNDYTDVRHTFVFMHRPLWNRYREQNGWPELESALMQREHTVIAGHDHVYNYEARLGGEYIIMGTTGGQSNLDGAWAGGLDHLLQITVDQQAVHMANLLLDGMASRELSTDSSKKQWNEMKREVLVYGEASPYQAGNAIWTNRLVMENHSLQEVTVLATADPEDNWSPVPHMVEQKLLPGGRISREVIYYHVQGDPTPPAAAWSWEAMKSLPHARPLSWNGYMRFSTGQPHHITGRVQGSALADPEHLRFQLPDDAGRFDVVSETNGVQLMGVIRDTQIVAAADRKPWEQDGVEIRMDARPAPYQKSFQGHPEHEIHVIAFSPGDSQPVSVYMNRDQASWVHLQTRMTTDGYSFICFIPDGLIERDQHAPWSTLRLNIRVNQSGGNDVPVQSVDWYPDWRSGQAAGSEGLFIR